MSFSPQLRGGGAFGRWILVQGGKVNDGMFSKGILAQASHHNIISFLSLMFPTMMFRAGDGCRENDLRLKV